MSFKEKKIEKFNASIESLSDYPSRDGVGPDQLKRMFDARADQIQVSINGIVDELTAPTAASNIGSAEGNVQRELDLKVDKENSEVIGRLRVETDEGDGAVEIIPSACDGAATAEIKISDISGFCAALGMDYDGGLTVSYGSENLEEKEKQGTVYTTLTHPNLDLETAVLSPEEQRAIFENLGLHREISTGILYLDTGYICKDGQEIVIYRPNEDIVPDSALRIGYDMVFSKDGKDHMVYHSGNLKDLTSGNLNLGEPDRDIVWANIGLTEAMGDIETALESILSMQEVLMGGGNS